MQSENPNNSDTWAKLVSLNPSVDNRNRSLTKDSYTIGKATTNGIQVSDDRVEDAHYRIYKETINAEDVYWVENLSSSGTVVEDKIINERKKRQLVPGDRIGCLYLSEMKSEVILTYVFCPTIKESDRLKRYREETQKLQNEIKEQKRFCDGQKNNLECTICMSLIYDCVTVMPCLHNFCASCISDWILKSEMCPNCKQEYTDIRKNYMLNETINSFLEMNPDLKQSKEIYDERDRKDRIKPFFEVITLSDGSVFEGYWLNGKKQGKGKMTFSDGDVYEGDWVNGKMEGKGKMIYADGGVYEGDWVNDQSEGKGKMIWPNGNIYEGDWVNDKREGKGKWIFPDGATYEGDWENDKREGQGKMIYLDGDVYEGDWVNNQPEGKGKMIYSNGGVYEGDWINGRPEGKGKMIWTDGNIYEGDWVNDRREGQGKMIYTDGYIYEGNWAKNVREGEGKLIFKNKVVYQGRWLNDCKKKG